MDKNHLPLDAIGRYITEAVPVAEGDDLIATVHKRIFANIDKYETINYVYVLGSDRKLLGVVSIKELARAKETQKLKEVMRRKLVTARAHTHKRRAAYLALKNSLKAVPVVDKNDKFLGVVASDALLSILYQDFQKHFLFTAGFISGKKGILDDTLKLSILDAFKHRVIWIVVGLIGGMMAANIVSSFEDTLRANIVLAAFIPLVVYLADAVGTQTQTLLVRDLAIEPKLPIIKYTFKQLTTTVLIGLLAGMLVAGIVFFSWRDFIIGLIVGTAVLISIMSSTLIAVIIPYLLSKLKQDPATGSGPFATIIQDISSIIIYFLTATVLLK